MDIKQKMALKQLAQRVSRGIISEDKAREEFKKITGRDPEDKPADDDQEGQELGEFMDALVERYKPEPQAEMEVYTDPSGAATEAVDSDARAVQVDTPKRTRSDKPKGKPKAQ